jgi:hypothetical protein
MPQPKTPADRRREALDAELQRLRELEERSTRPVVEARAWWLSVYAIVTYAIVAIAGIAVLIILLTQ